MAEKDADLEEEEEIGPDEIGDDDDLPGDDENPDLLADDEEEEEEDPLLQDDPKKKPLSRQNREVIKLRKRAQESDERARRAEEAAFRAAGSVDQLSRQFSTGNSEAQRRAEEERVAAMEPEERAAYRIQKNREETNSLLAQSEWRTANRIDKSDFKALCRENPAYARVAEEVENELAKLHNRGQSVDRQILADNLIGRKVANRAAKTGNDAQARGDKDNKRQKARPAGGRSDVAQARGGARDRKGKTAGERLANVKF